MRELATISVACRKTAAMAIGTLLVLGAARSAHAQEGVPQPPPLGAYFWIGPPDGSGNGNAADWNNWNGRYTIHAGSPPTIEHLPPVNGDVLFIEPNAGIQDTHHTVTLGSLNLPSSLLEIFYNADFSGGSLNVNRLDIGTLNTETFPASFTGTSFLVSNLMTVHTGNDAFTFSSVEIDAGELQLRGGVSETRADFPPLGGTPTINFNAATVNALTISLSNSLVPGLGLFVTNATNSQIQTLGMEIGLFSNPLADAAELNLYRSEAMIGQYLLVGSEGGGRLRIADQSTVTLSAPNNYVDVGQQGEGQLVITQASTLVSNLLNVGAAETGTMTLDHGGRVFTQSGVLGVLRDTIGTVTLSDDSKWQTKDLTIGDNGKGFVFIYDEATLHIDGQGILGHAEGSSGFLNLIGADAKLELGPSGTLTIGDEGAGLLNLAEGATFTSRGDVNLGEIMGSSGTVTVDGQDGPSTWTVNGALNIGVQSVGRVELNKGGKLTFTGTEIVLGSGVGGDGTLVLDGQDSTIESTGTFIVGRKSKGMLTIDNGAVFSAKKIVVGEQPGSEGLIEVKDSNQTGDTQLTVTESLHLGEMSKGMLTVDSAALETSGEAKLALTNGVAGQALLSRDATWHVEAGSTLTVGSQGPGAMIVQLGSTLKVSGDLVLADGGTSTGIITMSGASLLSAEGNGTIVVGKQGTADLNILGGSQYTSTSSSKLTIGSENGGVGTVTVTGDKSTFTSMGDLFVGKSSGSTGTIVVDTGGVLNVTPGSDPNSDKGFILGFDKGSKGTLEITSTTTGNGFQATQGVVVVGRAGEGTLMIRGALNQSPSTDFALGTEVTGKGTIDLSGGNALLVGHNFDIGLKGTGTLTLDDHAFLKAHQLNVGNIGSVTVAGDAQLQMIGGDVTSENTFNVNSGGKVSVDGDFLMNASQTHVTGLSFDTRDPSLIFAQNIRIGPNSSAIADVTGGARIYVINELSVLRADSKLTIDGAGSAPSTAIAKKVIVGSDAQLIVSGGGLLEALGGLDPTGIQIDPSGTLEIKEADSVAKVHGTLASSGSILVHAGGRVSADSVLVPRGGTIDLTGGRMIVGGDLDDVPNIDTNTLLVRPGGVVQANRDRNFLNKPTIIGKIINGGEFIVGQSPGSVLVDGDFDLQSTGRLSMEIGGFNPGVDYDQLVVDGNLSLAGVVGVQFIHGFAPHQGDQFTLITASQLTGTATVMISNLAPGFLYTAGQFNGTWMLTAINDGTFVKVPGDFNRDGALTAADLPAMLTALTDLNGWKSSYYASDADLLAIGDLDHSGAVTNQDIQSLLKLLASQGGGTVAPVPEPPSLILITCGGVLCWRKRLRSRQNAFSSKRPDGTELHT